MKNVLPPRWVSGPEICAEQNLPAFPSPAALRKFFASLPAISVKRVGLCSSCEGYHAETVCRPPSGSSSGLDKRNLTKK